MQSETLLALHTKASQYKRPLDAVRFLEDEFGKCDQKLHRFPELKVGNSDRHTVLLQSLSSECRQYIVLHGRSDTWENLCASIKFYEEQTRLCEPSLKLHGLQRDDAKKGLCWNCGKAGHYASECPKPRSKGDSKGKGHGKAKGKGKGKDADGPAPKRKSKPKPKPKPRAKSAGRNRQLEDNAGEQVMSLRDHHLFAAKSGDPGSSSTEPAPEPSRLTMSSEQMEKLRASNPSISHYAWLVDSGATCHVLSDQALSLYEVVREHSGPLPTLLSASDTAMECLKVVDIRVKFGKLSPVILQDVLVCKIGFNVVSPWQASMNGWDTFLTQGSDSCLSKVTSKGTIWVPLVREARSWWVFAKTRVAAKAKAKAKSGAKVRFDPDAMEVDKLKREQELEKKAPDRRESAMVSCHTTHRKVHEPPTGVSRALEVTPVKFLLKRMVKQDVLAGRKPLGESERAWLCKSAESCSLRACGSSSVCEREKALEDSSNSLVGMSACIGPDSLVGMSACVGSNSLVGMSAACVGSDSLVGVSAACVGQSGLVGMSSSGECGGADSSVGMSLSVRDQSFCDFGAGENKAPRSGWDHDANAAHLASSLFYFL